MVLKITFDEWLPGTAGVARIGYKRRKRVPGQWVVFDKEKGVTGLKTYAHGVVPVEFSSGDIDACHSYISQRRKENA